MPVQPNTLAQQYQRWLYEDYCYRWHQLTPAQKLAYQKAGGRYHLTGFQYFMKYMLTYLPDIAGMWRLDGKTGAIAYDSSRNLNHGIIIGASPIAGVIDGGFLFDGLNDWLDFGSPSTLLLDSYSLLCFYKLEIVQRMPVVDFTNTAMCSLQPRWSLTESIIYMGLNNYRKFNTAPVNILDGDYHCLVFKVTGNGKFDINNSELWADGQQQTVSATVTTGTPEAKLHFHIGKTATNWAACRYDNIILYNRLLDQTEITRHSLRRWPT